MRLRIIIAALLLAGLATAQNLANFTLTDNGDGKTATLTTNQSRSVNLVQLQNMLAEAQGQVTAWNQKVTQIQTEINTMQSEATP